MNEANEIDYSRDFEVLNIEQTMDASLSKLQAVASDLGMLVNTDEGIDSYTRADLRISERQVTEAIMNLKFAIRIYTEF